MSSNFCDKKFGKCRPIDFDEFTKFGSNKIKINYKSKHKIDVIVSYD